MMSNGEDCVFGVVCTRGDIDQKRQQITHNDRGSSCRHLEDSQPRPRLVERGHWWGSGEEEERQARSPFEA